MSNGIVARHITLPEVAPGQQVIAQGSAPTVRIEGDVGEGAIIVAQGGSALIKVGGYIHAHASLTAQGGGARIFHSGHHPSAQLVAQGGGAKVVGRSSSPKPPPDRSDLEFDTFGSNKRSVIGDTRVHMSVNNPPVTEHRVGNQWVTVQKSPRPREQWGT